MVEATVRSFICCKISATKCYTLLVLNVDTFVLQFGGRLITFSNVKQPAHGQGAGDGVDKRIVTISQVVTLPEFVARSQRLENALRSGTLEDFCAEKVTML